jgi:hypothetical protein
MLRINIPRRLTCTVAVAASIASLAAGGVAHATPKSGGSGKPTTAKTVTLSAPYQAQETSPCGPAVDLATGRISFDSKSMGSQTYPCNWPGGRDDYAVLGSKHGLSSLSSSTVTVRIDRLYVQVPRDRSLWLAMIVGTGWISESSSWFAYCYSGDLLTAAERESITPVTITGRDVSVTCPWQNTFPQSVWGGIRLVFSANVVELDARVTSIVARS